MSNIAPAKSQKAIYSKVIYDEIRAMSPPGRYLKQDPQTKLWSAIGEKKALDKTRQALREGAPELLKDMTEGTDGDAKEGKEAKKKSTSPEGIYSQLQRMPGNGRNPLADSLMGNNAPLPMGVNSNPFGVFGAQGPNSILAAAAQLQAAQQQGQQKQPPATLSQLEAQLQLLKLQMSTPKPPPATQSQLEAQLQLLKMQISPKKPPATQSQFEAELQLLKMQMSSQKPPATQSQLEAELQLLKMQMSSQKPPATQSQLEAQLQLLKMQMSLQHLANISAAQQQTIRNSSQSAGFNAVAAAQAQALNSVVNLPIGGSNDMTAVLAAMMNAPGTNPAAILAYQQQLAQVAMFNQMNSMNVKSDSTLMTGNLNKMNNTGNNGNGSKQLESKPPSDSSPATNIGSKRKSDGLNSSFVSIDTIDTLSSEKSNKRKSEGLKDNSSIAQAQRNGLKNSLTKRRPNRNIINPDLQNSMNNSMNGMLKNSLISIQSLTLNEIDSSYFDDGEKLQSAFEDKDTATK